MEKRGVIAPGVTPPEEPGEKRAADLEAHPTTRLAEVVAGAILAAGDEPVCGGITRASVTEALKSIQPDEKKLPARARRRF